MGSILVIGDTHFPFQSHVAMARIYREIELSRDIQTVIQVGDLYDFYSFSKYARSSNLMTPKQEIYTSRREAEVMWRTIRLTARRQHRRIRCIQMAGNHDERAAKRIMEKDSAYQSIVDDWLQKRLEFDGVETVGDEYVYNHEAHGDIMFMHGMRKFGEHAVYNQMNTVTGHLHRGGVAYFTNRHGAYWELNAGWVGDLKQPVFNYYSQKKISGTTLGYGLIDDYGPRFVHCQPWLGRLPSQSS